jgi:hypothetical protein
MTIPQGGSLADDIAPEAIATLLSGGEKHETEIPDFVATPADLKAYCANSEHFELCKDIFLEHELLSRDVVAERESSIIRAEEERAKIIEDRVGTRAYVDTDTDGVTDYDEVNIYRTNPESADTDSDGFADGAELLARTNPSGGVRVVSSEGSPSIPVPVDESVALDSPKISGLSLPNVLAVKNVVATEISTSTDGVLTATKLKLTGLSLPNAFVTLYIFSEPIVVTVKADGAGAWVYTLDKELPDGTHQVYSTITDAGGRILAKSEPLPFVKADPSAPGFFTGASLYAMIAILVGIFGIAISIIGFIVRQKSIADSEALPGL